MIFPTCLALHCIRPFGYHITKQLGNSAASRTRNNVMMYGPDVKVIVLIGTFNGNSIGKWYRWKFNVRDVSPIFTILPNGNNDNEAVLNGSQNNFDKMAVRKSPYF